MAGVGEHAPLELVRAGVTQREIEVLRHVVLRLSNREIAGRLVISTRTVESHVSALLAKLGAGSRRDLAVRGAALLEQLAASDLPAKLDSFVGRARELDAVAGLLASERLITLTGPAGVGKTRLAMEVARASGARVRLVDLAPAQQDTGVADRVLAALGVPQVPGRAALDTLADHASDRPVLVVMDNCEHVLAGSAAAVQTLLGRWPASRVLATSREPLGIPGEVVSQVEPLSVPGRQAVDVASVVAADAVRLLADRAWSSGAGFSVTEANAGAVALLCRNLDGLPLAVELIAPRLRTFTPGQLLGRLDDRLSLLASGRPGVPSRHRTLRRAVDWSFETLSEPERALFTALAVFAGSFSFEAVEAVCTEPAEDPSIMEIFPLLVDRSLVVAAPAGAANRYRLLETLRDYAREKLDPDIERSLRARHAGYFADLAERAEPQLRGARSPEWVERLRADQDNLCQALEWSLTHQPADALRMVAALCRFWADTDQRRSGIAWAERVLATGTGPPAVRVQALLATAVLIAPWDATRLTELAAEADDLARRLGDEQWVAHAKVCLAEAKAYATAPIELDTRPVEEAISYFRATGQSWQTASALRVLCLMRPPPAALPLLSEARRLFAAQGDRLQAANCAYMMAAMLARDIGDLGSAQELARDALTVFGQLGSEHEQAHASSVLAVVDYRNGAIDQAVAAARDCLAVFRRVADYRCVSATLLLLADIEQHRGDRNAALRLLRETLEVSCIGAHARTIPLALEHLARLLVDQDPLAAVTVLAAREAHRDPAARSTVPRPATELDVLQHAIQPAAFRAAWLQGSQASLQEILAVVDAAATEDPDRGPRTLDS